MRPHYLVLLTVLLLTSTAAFGAEEGIWWRVVVMRPDYWERTYRVPAGDSADLVAPPGWTCRLASERLPLVGHQAVVSCTGPGADTALISALCLVDSDSAAFSLLDAAAERWSIILACQRLPR